MSTSVWRNSDFRLVFVGGFVNNVGDWLLAVALPAYVYTETGSGSATAAVIGLELLVSILFGPTAGTLVDRWDLRRTVIATNLAQAATLLPLLAVTPDRLWPAFVVAILQGGLRELNDPASFALLPRIVPEDQLTSANAANAASGSIARLVGSPLGGIAVALGGLSAVVVADAVTFGAVALATAFVRTPAGSLNQPDEEGPTSTLRGGWREIRSRAPLVGYLVVQTLASFTFALFPVLFIAFVVDVLDGDEAIIGIIRGAAAFGGLLASYLVARRAKRLPAAMLMAIGYAGLGAVAFVFVNVSYATTALWLFVVLFALSGLPNITSQIGAVGAAQSLCPPELYGRFHGVTSAGSSAGAILGTVGAGVLVGVVHVRTLLQLQAGCYVLCGVLSYVLVVRRAAREPVAVS